MVVEVEEKGVVGPLREGPTRKRGGVVVVVEGEGCSWLYFFSHSIGTEGAIYISI